ncbi:MAG TPA: hypothetical protein VK152_02310 [Paludibacter sp.]|nr:hypothetical protein [Paludibacter sp.]
MTKVILYVTMLVLTLFSCTTTKKVTNVLEYKSDKLCTGIKNMQELIESSKDLKNHFKDILSDTTKLKYELDTIVTEGVPTMFFDKEISTIIMQNEKIPSKQAYSRLYIKSQIENPLKLNTRCINNTKIQRPDVKVSFWFYPEYGLLISEVSKIKYKREYGKGYLFLAKISDDGKLNIIKTTNWTE